MQNSSQPTELPSVSRETERRDTSDREDAASKIPGPILRSASSPRSSDRNSGWSSDVSSSKSKRSGSNNDNSSTIEHVDNLAEFGVRSEEYPLAYTTGSRSSTDRSSGRRSSRSPVKSTALEPAQISCSIIRHMTASCTGDKSRVVNSLTATSAIAAQAGACEPSAHPQLDNSVPKLWYFNARGRAEIIRLIFAQANVQYEDLRFRGPPHAMEDFERFKQVYDLPFGQVPVVEVDGILLAQSQAIVRYLAKKYKLAPANELENAFADMIYCGTEDLKQKYTTLLFTKGGSNLEETEAHVQYFINDTCHRWGKHFEKLLKKNGAVWIVGAHLTYADLSVYDMISSIRWRLPQCFSHCPTLLEYSKRIAALPGIAAHLARRPDVPI